MSAVDDVSRVEQFLRREAYLLDSHRFSEWLELYAVDARYWVPLVANQTDPFHTQSIIYDDKRLMGIRVRQQEHPRAHARLPLARTVHQVGNVLLMGEEDGTLAVASTLMLAEYRQERQRFYAASVTHHLRRRDDTFEIAAKRVDLINSESELDGIAFIF